MSYLVEGKPDDRHAVLPPRQNNRTWLAIALLLTASSALLAWLSQWFGAAPGMYAVLFGAGAFVTLITGAVRWTGQGKPRLWLDGHMLEYRQSNGDTVLFNLLTFGGAYVTIQRIGTGHVRIFLDFRTEDEEVEYRKTGFNPEPRPGGYLNRVPMAGVVGMDSMRAQYLADEINRRRGLT